MKDPYPKKLKDTKLWERFLDYAFEEDEYMFGILNWYREVGAILVEDDRFGYVIKPLTMENCMYGWTDEEEWKSEKRWLLPYWKTVAKLLKRLREEKDNEFKRKIDWDFVDI